VRSIANSANLIAAGHGRKQNVRIPANIESARGR
jgi:hypothetical protein